MKKVKILDGLPGSVRVHLEREGTATFSDIRYNFPEKSSRHLLFQLVWLWLGRRVRLEWVFGRLYFRWIEQR